ncbi:T9SS type A sorting domain-containing protein [Ekhidna sp.]|uniref:T9SS type A sorting domain-containing protein n=1 Tax=Ekhidna sp. TaxID=2608089 RepID=UPI003CCBFC5C
MRKTLILTGLAVIVGLTINKYSSTQESFSDFLKNHPYNSPMQMDEWEGIAKKDRPDLAMQQNFLMTVDPKTRTVPVQKLVNAFNKMKLQKADRGRGAIPGVNWTERGPNNVGGRTRALMWDPNDSENKKLWAAGVAGGIWFNEDVIDENSSWQNVDDFMANLAVTTLAYDPTNTETFYAGTGEGYFNGDAVRGAGIFKSTDGGDTWTQLEATSNSVFNYVQRIVVTADGTILASTRDGGVQRSIDGGSSWSEVLSSSTSNGSSSRANDLDIASNGDIYATLGLFSSGGIYRSIDDGNTWTDISPTGESQERVEVAVAASASSETSSTVLYAVATNGSNISWFKKSEDGGSNWTDLTVPQYRGQDCSESGNDFTRGQAWYDLALAVSPTNPDVVAAGGINVLRTGDGGENMSEVSYWTGPGNSCGPYVHADIHNIVFRPGNPNQAVIGSDGGVSYTADLGISTNPSFEDRNKDYNVTQFYAVAAKNEADENYYLAGAQDNGTQRFSNSGGLSTVEVTGGDGAFCFIDQDDPNFQISSYIRNNYYLLNGSGGQIGTLASSSSGRFINPADYDNTADILYSAGDEDELKRVLNVTGTPEAQETVSLSLNAEIISAIRADAIEENRIFIGTGNGGVYRVDEAHDMASVTLISSGISTAGYVSSIDIGSTDDELIVTFSNYGVSSVWYTTDGGETWQDKDADGSLPDMPVRWALFNPENTEEVLLATELGVWSTSSISADEPGWEQSSDNLANVRCDMLQYRSSDKLVVVATHGRGVYTSNVFDGLATPSGLIAEQEGEVINLTWTDNSVAEENYIVERSVGDNSSFSVIATLEADATSFVDANPATNARIFYRVYATSLIKGDSRVVEYDLLSLPGIPTLEDPTDVSSSQFTINWSVDDEVEQFVLDISEDSDFTSFVPGYQTRIVSDLSITVINRLSGTYYYRVAARNSAGLSDYSDAGTVTLDPLAIDSPEIRLYPNPVTNQFTLEGIDSHSTIEIVNVSGQRIDLEPELTSGKVKFDISTLPTGVYMVSMNVQGQQITKTIIKK